MSRRIFFSTRRGDTLKLLAVSPELGFEPFVRLSVDDGPLSFTLDLAPLEVVALSKTLTDLADLAAAGKE